MNIKYLKFLALIFILLSCADKTPPPGCNGAGKFVMTLKNQKGRIIPDTLSKTFNLHFSADGSLEHNLVAVPCNLPLNFQSTVNVMFDGNFYEMPADSSKFSLYIEDIDYN